MGRERRRLADLAERIEGGAARPSAADGESLARAFGAVDGAFGELTRFRRETLPAIAREVVALDRQPVRAPVDPPPRIEPIDS